MSTLWVLLLVLGSSRLLEAAAPSAPLRGASRELPQVAPSVPRIEDIYVLGERHSGTNFMRQFLEMNTKAQVSDTFCAFKHDYQNTNSPFCPTTHAATGFDRALVVIMLRNPYDWALAMHKVCWCGGKAMHKQANSLAFEDFMTRPFIESSPKFWLGETRYDPLGGTPDADTKTPCGTLMQCRALKYLNFLNVSTWALNVVFVRFEDVSSPDESSAWIQSLASRYRLELQGDAVKQTTGYKGYSYKGAKQFDAVAARAKMLWFTPQLLEGTESAGKVELVSRLMDADVERLVGYAPLAHTRRDALTAAADRIMAAVAKPGRPRADGA